MNLTKWFIAGLCVTAMTASATVLKSDSFESGTFGPGWLTVDATFTNLATGVTPDSNTPIVGAGDTKVLKLDTQGGVWTNTVNQSFALTNVFVDMLVKFVPSETLPTLDTSVKLAVAVTNGYLAVTKSGGTWNETNQPIDTNSWYRFSVELKVMTSSNFIPDGLDGYWEVNNTKNARVKINGTTVLVGGESDFLISDILGSTTLTAIGFQGTGFIDEVVVRDDDPFGGSAVLITLSFSAGIQSVFVGETQKLTTETVESGSDLIITAAQWKEISDVSGTDVTTSLVAGALNDTNATIKVTATLPGKTVTISAVTETSTTGTSGTGTLFDGAQMDKVATWALANSVTELTSGIYPNYLFNIPTNSVPSLFISSIAVSNTTVTVAVQTTNNVDLVTGINGTLKIKAYPVLGGTPEEFTTGFAGTTNITVFTQDIGTNKFVRASVE